MIYLDFSKALDKVPKHRLLYKLDHLGVRGRLLRWIGFFLSNRTFRVHVGEALSKVVQVISGIPQGSVLDPLLFIAFTADIKEKITSPFVMFGDDIKVYNTCSNYNTLVPTGSPGNLELATGMVSPLGC